LYCFDLFDTLSNEGGIPRSKEMMYMVNLNPLTLIEKLINEHGSSTILKERLELLKDQISALENEKGVLKSENAILNDKQNKTESQLNKAIKEVERLNQVIKGLKKDDKKAHLDTVTEKILKLFFDTGREMAINSIAADLFMDISTIRYHFDLLLKDKLIIQTKSGWESSFPGLNSPEMYDLTPSGREYVIKNILA
jgi:hypothetical protein